MGNSPCFIMVIQGMGRMWPHQPPTPARIRGLGIAASSAPGKRSLLGAGRGNDICVYNIYLEYIVWYLITVIYCVHTYIYIYYIYLYLYSTNCSPLLDPSGFVLQTCSGTSHFKADAEGWHRRKSCDSWGRLQSLASDAIVCLLILAI